MRLRMLFPRLEKCLRLDADKNFDKPYPARAEALGVARAGFAFSRLRLLTFF
jgi:hypothetical protein